MLRAALLSRNFPRSLRLAGWMHPADATSSVWVDRISGAAFVGTGSPVCTPTEVACDAVDDLYTYPGIPPGWPVGADGCEVWMRVNQTEAAGVTTARTVYACGTTSVATGRSLQRTVVSGSNRLNAKSTSQTVTDGAVDMIGVHVIAGLFPEGGVGLEIDGSATALTAVTHAVGTTSTRFGSNASGGGLWKGGIGESLIIAGSTSEAQRSAIRRYLA